MALTFVLGSNLAAEHIRVKRPRRRAAARASAPPTVVVEERERELADRR